MLRVAQRSQRDIVKTAVKILDFDTHGLTILPVEASALGVTAGVIDKDIDLAERIHRYIYRRTEANV